MTAGAVPVLWPNKDGVINIETVGRTASCESGPRQLLLWPLERLRTMSRSRSSSSWGLWRRVRWLLSSSPSTATESVFRLWLRNKIGDADFGALTIEYVEKSAREELIILDDDLLRWLAHYTAESAEFASDGVVITIRD